MFTNEADASNRIQTARGVGLNLPPAMMQDALGAGVTRHRIFSARARRAWGAA